MQTDKAFWHGLQRIVQGRQNSDGKGKTFLYRFAVDSPTQNHYKISRYGTSLRGVCHADEISYLFKNKYVDVPHKSSTEFKSIERLVCKKIFLFYQQFCLLCFSRKHELYTFLSYSQVSVFTSFASTGNPNSNIIDADMENVEWKPVDTQQPPFKCLNLDVHLSAINLPESERLTIWNELYEATNTKLY
jgi:Carboxylesterase family